MDNLQYIKVGALNWIVQAIPECANDDTVVVEIRRLSDGYTWNFTTTAFTSAGTTGNMTFVNDILWKQSFTPPTEDTYIVTITDSTLDVKYVQVLKAVGAVAQSGVTGTELTTLAHVREFLDLEDSFTDRDTLIENLISRVSDNIEKECGRTFHATDLTEYYDGQRLGILLTKNFPINSVTALYDDPDREYGADSLLDSDDYTIYSEEGMIKLDGLWFCGGHNNVKIQYNAGYSTIPTDLESACIKLVAVDYLSATTAVNDKEASAFREKLDTWKDEAEKIINKYRRIR